MLMAATAGRPFEDSGVPDLPHNRALFGQIESEVAAVPAGQVVHIPFDHALMK
jgi:hypothetical protein